MVKVGSFVNNVVDAGSTTMTRFRAIVVESDGEFTSDLQQHASELEDGIIVIGVGPVSFLTVRDAQSALRELGSTIVWLAPRSDTEVQLGLPNELSDSEIEASYAAVEAAFPDLLDPRIQVEVAPIARVLALASARSR